MRDAIVAASAAEDWLLTGAGRACWAAAAAFAIPWVRERAGRAAEAIDAAPEPSVRRAVLAGGTAAALWLVLLKAGQYRGFQLPLDTSIMTNATANFAAGHGLTSVVFGTPNIMAIHFACLIPVFLAPLLLLWKSAFSLILAQNLALASMGPAAFLLARRRSGSAFLGFVAMGLTYAHPSIQQLGAAGLENAVFIPPLFLWGVLSWESGRRGWSLLLWGVALTAREQVPFTLAGLAVYAALGAEGRPWTRAAAGLAGVLACAVLWVAELRFTGSFPSAFNDNYWNLYGHFGATKAEVVSFVLHHPHRAVLWMFWPPSHLLPLARLVAHMAFLPLADPPALLVLLASAVHHLLQARVELDFQYASYTFGPLVFAAVSGLARLDAVPALRARRGAVLALALASGGTGLAFGHRTIEPALSLHLVDTAPGLVRLVPEGSSVWAEDLVLPWLAARPQAKGLGNVGPSSRFEVLLFRPEYVLVDKTALAVMVRGDEAKLVGFLAREGYAKVGEAGTLVLLKDPQAPRAGASPALTLGPAPGDAERVAPYLSALFDSEDARRRLGAYPPDLRCEPQTSEGEANFARLLMARGLPGLALGHARSAVTLHPDAFEPRGILAAVLFANGEASEAGGQLEEARRLKPGVRFSFYSIAVGLLSQGKAREALRLFDEELRQSPGHVALLNNRGAALLMLGRREEAAASFEEALRLAPGNATALANLAAARSRARR